MGLEDRDWYREESSKAYWREVDRSMGSPSPSDDGRGRVSWGLVATVCISGALILAGWNRYLPGITLAKSQPEKAPSSLVQPPADAPSQSVIRLGSSPRFENRGLAGVRWCVTTAPAGQICAVTGTAESGREALSRVLRARGFDVSG